MTSLIPPDRKQCQAEITPAYHPLTMGGDLRRKVYRCPNKAAFILTELVPASDGMVGSMSVCESCNAEYERMRDAGKAPKTRSEAL